MTSSRSAGALIIPASRRDEETLIIEKIRKGEQIENFDTVRVRKDKTQRDISLTISPIRDGSGKIIGASKIARDITQRKRIERELRESEERYRTLADALDTQVQFRTRELERRNSELRELSGRLMESQDVERRHIARELHDSAGQTLAALGMNLAQLAQEAKNNPAQAKGIAEVERLVQHLSREIRTTSYLLHPPLLDESGLKSALNWFAVGPKGPQFVLEPRQGAPHVPIQNSALGWPLRETSAEPSVRRRRDFSRWAAGQSRR